MTQTITLPDLWLIIAPCGCIDGWLRTTHLGTVTRPDLESAWLDFSPLKRDRTRQQKQGFTVRGGEYAEWNGRSPQDCPHDPKWGIPSRPTPTTEQEESNT